MNFCAVGTGAITKSMLAEYQRSPVLHCTAICSRKEETGRAMAEAFWIETVYTSMEDMLRDPSIELVYVASPNALHYAQTKACLEAGKHVICEKPCTPLKRIVRSPSGSASSAILPPTRAIMRGSIVSWRAGGFPLTASGGC